MIKFKIIVPMYNVEDWAETTIKSVLEQTYTNYSCVIIDDMSTDDSVDVVKNLIRDNNKFSLIINQEKKYALQNIIEAIEYNGRHDEDVIIILDGDDFPTITF